MHEWQDQRYYESKKNGRLRAALSFCFGFKPRDYLHLFLERHYSGFLGIPLSKQIVRALDAALKA